jgi:hypothetical protein
MYTSGHKVWVCVNGEVFVGRVESVLREGEALLEWGYRQGKLGTLLHPNKSGVFNLETKQMIPIPKAKSVTKAKAKGCYFMDDFQPRNGQKVRVNYVDRVLSGNLWCFSETNALVGVGGECFQVVEVPCKVLSFL